MLPILFVVGPIKIYSMGLFLLLALFWGSFLLYKNTKLTSNREEEIFDGLFASLFGALIFARLFYVIFNFNDFGFSFLKFILINGYPGLSLWGGILGGFATFWIYCRIYKHKFIRLIDHAIPAIFMALFWGKLGVFFSGSDVGTPTNFFLSVMYEGYEKTRHITPIYESVIYLIFTFISHRVLMAIRREKFFEGFNFILFLIVFSCANILLDFFYADNIYFLGFSLNLIISLSVLLLSGVFLVIKFNREILNKFSSLRKKGKSYGHIFGKKNKAGTGKKAS